LLSLQMLGKGGACFYHQILERLYLNDANNWQSNLDVAIFNGIDFGKIWRKNIIKIFTFMFKKEI
jgi:hypothetical protein